MITKKTTEFNQALQNDACRLQQLQCHTAAPGHAFNQFFWGKLELSLFFFTLLLDFVLLSQIVVALLYT